MGRVIKLELLGDKIKKYDIGEAIKVNKIWYLVAAKNFSKQLKRTFITLHREMW